MPSAPLARTCGFRRSTKLSVGQGVVATYVHNSVSDGLGKLGVLVALETEGEQSRCGAPLRPPGRHARRGHQPAGADRR